MNIRRIVVGVLTALSAVPLVVAPNLWYADIDGKMIAIRVVAALVSLLICIGTWMDVSFREQLYVSWMRTSRQSLFRAIFVGLGLLCVSAVFALHPTLAFLGEPQRGEGVLTIASFILLYISFSLFFTRRDWTRFFAWTLGVATIVFCIQVWQAIGGMARPEATLGNPIFLAGYYLFVLLCAYELRQYRVLATIAGGIAFVGIFLTQSRGVVLGALLGLLIVAVVRAVRMPTLRVGRMPIRRAVLALCIALTVTAGGVYMTRTAALWKHVPVVGRITAISSQDATTHSRLLFSQISLSGWWADRTPTRVLLGVGGENFVYVWMKHYNPHVYFYDTAIADRAHNKLVDVLVMTGILGLAAYLAMWFFAARTAWRIVGASSAALIFWMVAYFFQNVFAFDSISTYLTLYVVMAYTGFVYAEQQHAGSSLHTKKETRHSANWLVSIISTCAALVFCVSCVVYTIVPYMRMRAILTEVAPTIRGESAVLLDPGSWEYRHDAFALINAQSLVDNVLTLYMKGELTGATPLLSVSVEHLATVAAHDDSTCTTCYLSLGKGYDLLARLSDGDVRTTYIQKADAAFSKGLMRLPRNPALAYAYALHLSDAGRVDEGVAVLQSVLKDDPRVLQTKYYLGMLLYQQSPGNSLEALSYLEQVLDDSSHVQIDPATVKLLYTKMLQYFYATHDKDRFMIVARRLSMLDPQQSTVYGNIVKYVQEQGSIPQINFNSN